MWQMQLLGSFRLASGTTLALPSVKGQALFGLLGVAGSAGLTRERIVGLLWEGVPPERARQSLRQLLSELRRDIGFVQTGSADRLLLDPRSVSVDLWQFELAAPAVDPDLLQEATALYSGALLQGAGARPCRSIATGAETDRMRHQTVLTRIFEGHR
ncbi:hypothetical protein [Piscinibacter sp.]|uniref:AfsR/SARP family transcriptional regulator n=1 Tax=Piscinibacter sp. TaxID=1903157 RepID=UPI00355AB69F